MCASCPETLLGMNNKCNGLPAAAAGAGGMILARQFRRHQWCWRGGAANTASAPAPRSTVPPDGGSDPLSGREEVRQIGYPGAILCLYAQPVGYWKIRVSR